MTDIKAGARIQAADRPASTWEQDSTAISNISSTTYIPGSPVVDATFVAPTSGRVLLIIGGGTRDNSALDQVYLAPEVYLGTSAAGTKILSANADLRGTTTSDSASQFTYASRATLLTGLTPGATYYARVVYHARVGNLGAGSTPTADISSREIMVVPTS